MKIAHPSLSIKYKRREEKEREGGRWKKEKKRGVKERNEGAKVKKRDGRWRIRRHSRSTKNGRGRYVYK